MTPSAGADPTSVGMLIVVGVGQLVTWLVMLRSGQKQENRRAAKDGADQASETANIRELAQSYARVASALESLEGWARNHDLADTRWQSGAEQIMKQQAATASDMQRMLEGLQRQLSNVALGLAPATAAEIPANRARGGR